MELHASDAPHARAAPDASTEAAGALLIIDGQAERARRLRLHLRKAGFATGWAGTVQDRWRRQAGRPYALVLVRAALPDGCGFDLCRRLRAHAPHRPVFLLGAEGEAARIRGLSLGADVVLGAGCSMGELVAHVRALFRRLGASVRARPEAPQTVRLGALAVDYARRKVTRRGQRLHLTPMEFDLLALLARHPGRTFRREELLDRVWGYAYAGYGQTVSTHVNRLRSKVEADPARPRYVLTVWGVGYRMAEPADVAAPRAALPA